MSLVANLVWSDTEVWFGSRGDQRNSLTIFLVEFLVKFFALFISAMCRHFLETQTWPELYLILTLEPVYATDSHPNATHQYTSTPVHSHVMDVRKYIAAKTIWTATLFLNILTIKVKIGILNSITKCVIPIIMKQFKILLALCTIGWLFVSIFKPMKNELSKFS